jgi:hypothetical protein
MVWAFLEKLCCGCETICGVDTDHLFAYTTPKYVNILDRRLGITKYFLTGVILIYVLVYEVWYNGGYLAPTPVQGYARFTLQQPTVDNCDPKDPTCLNNFQNLTALPYCTQSPLNYSAGNSNKAPCHYWDFIQAQYMMTDAIVMATRASEDNQVLVNSSDGSRVYSSSKAQNFYIADAEAFTLLIDHGVSTGDASLSGEARSMEHRKLYLTHSDANTALCQNDASATTTLAGTTRAASSPCYITPPTVNGMDFLPLSTFLQASGTTLDAINYGGVPFRNTGAIVVVGIEYQNFFSWSLRKNISYAYHVSMESESEYKQYQAFYDPYPTNRTVVNTHGLYFKVVQTGNLYTNSWNVFLIQLTTSLTLLAIANTIVDLLALYVMPDRKKYYELKYETSEDFSELRKAEQYQALPQEDVPTEAARGGAAPNV